MRYENENKRQTHTQNRSSLRTERQVKPTIIPITMRYDLLIFLVENIFCDNDEFNR